METGAMEALLRSWRESSNAEALGELLKAQRDRAYSAALRLTGSSSDAEDVVQQAFLKLLSRTSGIENLEEFEQSVYRAVVQCGLDLLRQRKRQAVRESHAEEHTVVEHAAEQNLEDAETVVLLRAAVRDLPDDERAPVVLCYYQGLSTVSAARTLELPRETLRARLERALGHLREALRRKGKDTTPALILPLLWRDGNVAAPESLCKTLDQILPGRPCAQLPALKQPGPIGAPASAGLPFATGLAAALVVASLAGGAIWIAQPATSPVTPQAAPAVAVVSNTITNKEGPPAVRAPSAPLKAEKSDPKEEEAMKAKLGAVILTGSLLAPGTLNATEPNADVAKTIAEIAARRDAKAEAAARAASAVKRESREGHEGAQIIWGQPGAVNGIQIGR